MLEVDEQVRQDTLDWQRGGSQWYEILGSCQVTAVVDTIEGDSLLDLGCGDGLLTRELERWFARVLGVDACEAHIEVAKDRCLYTEFVVSLIEEFETEERFDNVTVLCLLEHVVDPVDTLRRAASFLKEGGHVVAQVPNALAINRRIGKMMGVLEDEYELSDWDMTVAGHRRYYDMQLLMKDFERAGLSVTSTIGIFYKMLSTPQMEWLVKHGLWGEHEYGWGNLRDFVRASYDLGKERPEGCNIIQVCGRRN